MWPTPRCGMAARVAPIVSTLRGLVIFGAEDGTIGAGCIRKLADAAALGIRVAGLDLGRGLREISGFDLIDMGSRSARRTAPCSSAKALSRRRGQRAGEGPKVTPARSPVGDMRHAAYAKRPRPPSQWQGEEMIRSSDGREVTLGRRGRRSSDPVSYCSRSDLDPLFGHVTAGSAALTKASFHHLL